MKMNKKKENDANVTKEDLMLMVDLFFLPYEHGSKAKHLVSEFKWIQANAPPIETNKQNEKLVSPIFIVVQVAKELLPFMFLALV